MSRPYGVCLDCGGSTGWAVGNSRSTAGDSENLGSVDNQSSRRASAGGGGVLVGWVLTAVVEMLRNMLTGSNRGGKEADRQSSELHFEFSFNIPFLGDIGSLRGRHKIE